MAERTHQWSAVLRVAAVAALISMANPVVSATPDPRLLSLRSELIARADPDSLATAAFFERLATGQWHDAPALAARAAAAAPNRIDLAYMQLVLCYQLPACDSRPLETGLRERDPANGITWLYALGRATRTHDDAGSRAAVNGMARTQRIDVYWTELVSHMVAAVTGRAGFDGVAAFAQVVGIDAAMVLPPVAPIRTYCSQPAVPEEDILDQCRRIFAAFAQSDSLLFNSYGNHQAVKVWPAGSAEGNAYAAAGRVVDYRVQLLSVQAATLNSAKATTLLAALYPKYHREEDAIGAWYQALGLNPDPP